VILIAAALAWLIVSITVVAVCLAAAWGDAQKVADEDAPVPLADVAVSPPLGDRRGAALSRQLRARFSSGRRSAPV
jgi:hypothetical protein